MGGSEKILTGILGVVFWFSISACGGDGGGGGGEASPTQGTTISGSVQAPSGQIAFNHSLRFLTQLVDLFHPSAYASITGTSPVPDGTLVQLARLIAHHAASVDLVAYCTRLQLEKHFLPLGQH